MTSGDPGQMRISRLLSRAGIASRRESERYIEAGRIAVNGVIISNPAIRVGTTDRVAVDGKPVPKPGRSRLWRHYKRRGLVTTHRDERDRPTVFDSLPGGLGRVMSVGRLDINSEGLLLLTNDGNLKRWVELPSTGWKREYRVRVHGRIHDRILDKLRRGIVLDGISLRPMEVTPDLRPGTNSWLTIGLREGKNREIRRALANCGLTVNRLIRTSYGPFDLRGLKPGVTVEVRRGELTRETRGFHAAN